MQQSAILFGASCIALANAGPAAAGSAPLSTLPHGHYTCSLPGDADGNAWTVVPAQSFEIDNASTYRTADGSGIYLMTSDRVRFTRGPMKGRQFVKKGKSTLVELDAHGQASQMRCTRGPSTRG